LRLGGSDGPDNVGSPRGWGAPRHPAAVECGSVKESAAGATNGAGKLTLSAVATRQLGLDRSTRFYFFILTSSGSGNII
jgi:hypothetical protein